MSGAYTAGDVFTNTVNVVSENVAGYELTRQKHDQESNHITISIDVHTAFLHADVDHDVFAEPPEPDKWYDAGLKEDELWKLNKALYGCRKSAKIVASTPRVCPGNSELSPTPDGHKLFPKR